MVGGVYCQRSGGRCQNLRARCNSARDRQPDRVRRYRSDREIFTPTKGTGNQNKLGDRRTIVLGDNAVVVTGFYEFTRMQEGKPVPAPSRFTMLVVKRNGEWRIAHHHSSPHVQPKQ